MIVPANGLVASPAATPYLSPSAGGAWIDGQQRPKMPETHFPAALDLLAAIVFGPERLGEIYGGSSFKDFPSQEIQNEASHVRLGFLTQNSKGTNSVSRHYCVAEPTPIINPFCSFYYVAEQIALTV